MARIPRSKGHGGVSFNMTPMIDIVFNLIIFFMLISQFQQLEIENVILPPAVTAEPKDYTKFRNIVINIVDPDRPQVRIFGNTFEPDVGGVLEKYLLEITARGGEEGGPPRPLNVILRADARVPYEAVAAVMLAAGRAKIQGWWITTEIEDLKKRG
jgi:biopolymer transport protein ExbD